MNIVTHSGQGQVVVIDHRKNGSVIVLICHEATESDSPIGPVVPPKGGVFPMGMLATQVPTVELVTSELPSGPQPFHLEQFTAQFETALRQGDKVIEFTEDTAELWGWVRPTSGS